MKKIIKWLLLSLKYRHCKIKSKDISFDVILGANVKIYDDVYIANKVKIGKYTYISYNTKIYENTIIGSFCSIAPNCVIGPGNHDYTNFTTHPIIYDNAWNSNLSRCVDINKISTVIGNDVWIGCNAIIINGINIGTGAVIGAGTVVTKDVPPYAIVVGNPGRIIKYRFNDKKIKEILDSNWWEKDIKEIIDGK